MFRIHFFKKTFSFLLTLLLATSSVAQSLETEQSSLKSLLKAPPAIEKRISLLSAQSESFERKIVQAKNDVIQSDIELQGALKAAEAAKQEYQSQPSQDTDRVLRKNQHRLAMAERGVKSRQKRLDRIQGKFQKSAAQLKTAQQELSQSSQKIRSQRLKIERVREQIQQQESIAQEKFAINTRAAAAAVAETLRQNKLALIAEKKSAQDIVVTQTLASAKAQAASGGGVQKTVKTDEGSISDGATLSAAQEKQKSKIEVLLAKIAEAKVKRENRRALYKRLTIKGNKLSQHLFTHIADNYYRTEAVVTSGPQLLEVGHNRLKRDIPKGDDGKTYVFIYHAKTASRGKLWMYDKALLDGVDQSK